MYGCCNYRGQVTAAGWFGWFAVLVSDVTSSKHMRLIALFSIGLIYTQHSITQ